MGIRFKFTALFALFAVLPLAAAVWTFWSTLEEQQKALVARHATLAVQLADVIDRNFFERYGDVQAFGLNQVITADEDWRSQAPQITQAMNGYVNKYGLYPLMLLVDTSGRIVAVNDRNAAGESIRTRSLVGQNVSASAWFKRLRAQDYTVRRPYTSQANLLADGTVMVDPYVDEYVQQVYSGHSGVVIGFGAPVERGGRTVAYWYNMADIAVVEEMAVDAYRLLVDAGFDRSEVVVLGPDGEVLVAHDPLQAVGAELPQNPVTAGLPAAAKAHAGQVGGMLWQIPGSGSEQVVGYAPTVGALGFPGMGWSVTIGTDANQAFATILEAKQTLLMQGAVILLVILLVGFIVGGWIARPLQHMARMAADLARGDLTGRVSHRGGDELGQLAGAMNKMAEDLQEMFGGLAGSARELEDASGSLSSVAENVVDGSAQTANRATAVAAAAEQMSQTMLSLSSAAEQSGSNIRTVAEGARNLSSTIADIAGNADQASQVSVRAVSNVKQASDKVMELSEASNKINAVIDVILEIAEQTKLLALNATIEAARAGEAGKGFAVVASEVKELAQQTNQATEEIRDSITAMQQSTGDTVSQITGVSEIIDEVSDIIGNMARSIEMQSATTREIATNIDQAAEGLTDMTGSVSEASTAANVIARDIAEVDGEVARISGHAGSVEEGSRNLARLGGDLNRIVSHFQAEAQ